MPNVLACVDHPTTRTILSASLKKLGFDHELAEPRSVVAASSEVDYDLVLLDLELDEGDAFELCRGIRGEETDHRAHIIGLSADRDDQRRAQSLEAGMDDCLIKPMREADLQRLRDQVFEVETPTSLLSEPQLLDRIRLDELRRLERQVGEVVVEPMVLSFLDSESEVLASLREAAAARNWRRLRSEIHGFLGRALNLGAIGLGSTSRELQELARAERAEGIEDCIRRLELGFDGLADELREYLEERS